MRIAVIGGGSAGWMTAAYIKCQMPKTDLFVIDKQHGEPVGVGEATILDFEPFMKAAGFEKKDWFPALDATVKGGILFPNWLKKGHEVWHPFFINYYDYCNEANIWDYWCAKKELDFKDYATMMYDSCVRHNKIDPDDESSYAFHVDCGKLTQYIQSRIQDSITIIKEEVVKVHKDGNNVTKLDLINGEEFYADLFIDCTGFRSILKKADKVDLSDRLFCDTAIAGRIPYIDEKEFIPYVICDAVDHGWIWKIPTASRLGTGLVFNRSITDIEQAKKYFHQYWGGRLPIEDMKVIDWTPYYSKNFWEGNVVSIGLSGGFIEPLESTGLSCMIKGIINLEERIRVGFYTQKDIDFYNLKMKCYYEDAIDFVNMHYSKTERTEPFWEYVKKNHKDSEYLAWMKQIMKDPEFRDHVKIGNQNSNTIFHPASWFCWMAQLGYEFNSAPGTFIAEIAETKLLNFYSVEQKRKEKCLDHIQYVNGFREI